MGVSPAMLVMMNYEASTSPPIVPRTAVGLGDRVFELPLELSGFSMTIGGIGCGIKSVNGHQVTFVVPPHLASTIEGTPYPVVINNQGTVIRGTITIVPTRPDIFNIEMAPEAGGRANIKNVTNRVHTGEPFTVTTIKIRGGVRVPSVLRIKMTGIANITDTSIISIRMGDQTTETAEILTLPVYVEPGVYSIDFTPPPELNGAGDVPVVVTVRVSSTPFTTRLDDTTSWIRFL